MLENQSGLSGQVVRGLGWMSTSSVALVLIRLSVFSVLAHLLAPSDFGLVTAALIIVNFLPSLVLTGISSTIIQRADLSDADISTAFTISLLAGATFAVLLYLLGPGIGKLFRMDDLPPILRTLSFVPLIHSFSVISESLLQKDLNFRTLAIINLVSHSLGYGGVGIGLAMLGAGTWALVVATIMQKLIRTIMTILVRSHPKEFLISSSALSYLMFMGGGFTAGRVANYIALQVDNFIVGRCLGSDGLGLYSRAYQLMALPAGVIGQAMDNVLFPAMATMQNEKERLRRAYLHSVSLSALVSLPISCVAFVLAPEIIQVLFGKGWEDSIPVFKIFLVGMFFRTSYKTGDTISNATGTVYPRAGRQLIYAILVFLASWVGHYWGLSGVALGVLIAVIVNFLLMAQLGISISQSSWQTFIVIHVRPFIFSAIILIFTYLIAWLPRSVNLAPVSVLLTSLGIILSLFLILCPWILRIVLDSKTIELLANSLPRIPGSYIQKYL